MVSLYLRQPFRAELEQMEEGRYHLEDEHPDGLGKPTSHCGKKVGELPL